jgi:hypothetical protein
MEEDGAADEAAGGDFRPDIEAEEISPTKKKEAIPLALNKEDLFKPISEYEMERLKNQANSPEKQPSGEQFIDEDKSQKVASKSKAKKKKKSKKSKKKKANEEEEVSDDDEEEDDYDDVDEEEEEAKKQKEREDDEEPSGCCQFCFWNFREGHRCLSFFSYYNRELNRPSRWVILVMSWYLFQAFSGFFIGGPNVSIRLF